jgi:hypothetical protein
MPRPRSAIDGPIKHGATQANHFPICSVKDSADPKVAETLKRIQEARAKD